jgi:DNA-binding XRE family transcriptional regulator
MHFGRSKGFVTKLLKVSRRDIGHHDLESNTVSSIGLRIGSYTYKSSTLRRMITGESKMKDYRKAKKTIAVSVGESVRIMRELQELSQTQLAELTGIPQSTISSIENDRINLGVERAKTLARALRCHPAVLVFPGWEIKDQRAA